MSQKTKIACLLCRGLISFKNGDRSRFLDHMNNEHDARYDFDVVLVVSLMTDGEKKVFVNTNQDKLEALTGNTNKKGITDSDSKSLDISSKSKLHSIAEVNIAEVEMIDNASITETIPTTPETNETQVPNQETVTEEVAEPVKREGVLKCKICSKYIKQSQLLDHRTTHAEKDGEPVVHKEDTKETDDGPKKDSETVKPSPVTNNKSEIGDEGESPRRGKRKGDGSEDEDWVAAKVKRKNPKSISCNMCRKKFSSKLGLTAHERMVHKDSKKTKGSEEEPAQNAYKMQETTRPSQTNHPSVYQKPPQTTALKQTPVKQNNQKPIPSSKQKPILPSNQKPNQPSNQKPTKLSIPKPTQPSTLKTSQPSLMKSTQPSNQKPSQPSIQKTTQPSILKPTDPSYQEPIHPRNYNLANPVDTTPRNQTSQMHKEPKQTAHRDPRQRTKAQVLSSDVPSPQKTYEDTTLPIIDSSKVNEQVKPTNQPTKTPTQPTPIGTSTMMYVANEESLLLDDFDFNEDEAPLTIDESFETVTVEVGENSKYYDFGDITQTDALLIDIPVK